MDEPFFSVIVPIYNVKDYVEAAVASVTGQALYRAGNVELLLIDDASTDGSGALCDRIAANDPRVRVLHRAENGGPSAARNIGIRAAAGTYLQFLDSDDTLLAGALDTEFSALAGRPDVLLCRYTTVNAKTGETAGCPYRLDAKTVASETGEALLRYLTEGRTYGWYTALTVVRRAFLTDRGLYFTEGRFFEDALWTPPVLFAAASAAYCDPPVYRYVTYRPGSNTNTVTPAHYADRLNAIECTDRFCAENGFSAETSRAMLSNLSATYVALLADWFSVKKQTSEDFLPALKRYREILKYAPRRYQRILYRFGRVAGIRAVAAVLALRAAYVRKKYGT